MRFARDERGEKPAGGKVQGRRILTMLHGHLFNRHKGLAYRVRFGRSCSDGAAVSTRIEQTPEPALSASPHFEAGAQMISTTAHMSSSRNSRALSTRARPRSFRARC